MRKARKNSSNDLFDKMFLERYISHGEHEAAHRFIDALANSGGSIQSLDPSKSGDSVSRRDRESASDKRMIFSSAYRCMVEACDESILRIAMRYFHNPNEYIDEEKVEEFSSMISPALKALSKFYRIDSMLDPRDVVLSMIYVAKEHDSSH